MNLPLVLMSFGVGILIGLTSMGGAALMAPFLILVIGVRPVTAVGTDLVYGAITKIIGAWVHMRQGTVDMPVVRKLATGSIPGGLAGALLVILLPRFTNDAEHFVKKAIGTLLLLVAVVLLARVLTPVAPATLSVRRLQFLHDRGTMIWGAIVGFCVGMTSVGSGSLLAPFLMMLYPSKTSKVVGTDVFHAAVLVSVTGLFHATTGGVEWTLIPTLLTGSIPGVLLGSRLATRIPARPLRTGLAALLLVTGYSMF
ncbi:MAG TPA: sulfite exporter TauE/SafE family protein [Bryobacteraceae bacterium]|nr:sulfite exporter TauE/SafE family protein [Bryobacteraceae bacterium]